MLDRATQDTDSSEDEVSLIHAPMAVNWHVSKRALPRRQSLSQASATDSDDDKEWLRDDLLSNDDSDLAHAPNTTHTSAHTALRPMTNFYKTGFGCP